MMTRRIVSFAVFASFLIGANPGTGAAAEVLRVGATCTLSGPAASWGIPSKDGLLIQADMINKAGGIKIGNKTYNIELTIYDDKYSTEATAAAFNRLVYQDKVKFIVFAGPGTPPMVAGAPICQQNKILFLCNGTAAPPDPNMTYTFRVCPSAFERYTAMLRWFSKNRPDIKKVVIVGPDNDPGRGDANTFKNRLQTLTDWKIESTEFYEIGTKDFYPILSKVLKVKPDLIDCATPPAGDMGLIVKQARELGFKGPMINGSVIDPDVILKIAGKDNSDKVYLPNHTIDFTPEIKELMTQYHEKHHDYNSIVVFTADYLYLFQQALEKAGTLEVDKVKQVLETGTFKSRLGPDARFYGDGKFYGKWRNQWLCPLAVSVVSPTREGNVELVGRVSAKEMYEIMTK